MLTFTENEDIPISSNRGQIVDIDQVKLPPPPTSDDELEKDKLSLFEHNITCKSTFQQPFLSPYVSTPKIVASKSDVNSFNTYDRAVINNKLPNENIASKCYISLKFKP